MAGDTEVLMPLMGEGITEVEVVTWHVQVGDTVAEEATALAGLGRARLPHAGLAGQHQAVVGRLPSAALPDCPPNRSAVLYCV